MESTSTRFSRIKKIGVEHRVSEDAYHYLLKLSWFEFIFYFFTFVFIFNFLFAVLFWLIPNSIKGADGSLFDCFSFSVQTFSTVGYGVFSPQTRLAHIIVILESVIGVLATSVFTGLIFAKFARPTARVIFSKNILITTIDNQKTLVFRVGNLRSNQILEASAKVVLLKPHVTPEGLVMRKQFDLQLQRDRTSFFALSWVLFHTIDEKSPLHGVTQELIESQRMEVGVSITGHDETFLANVFASCLYNSTDFIYDKQFHDVLVNNDQGRVVAVDYTKFHDLI